MLNNLQETNEHDDFLFNTSAETKLIKKNNIIYKIDQNIKEIYIILEGEAESSSEKNKKKLILRKGSVLGLMDTILNRNYSKEIKAKTSVVLAIIKKEKVKKKFSENIFQFALIKALAIDIDNNNPNSWS